MGSRLNLVKLRRACAEIFGPLYLTMLAHYMKNQGRGQLRRCSKACQKESHCHNSTTSGSPALLIKLSNTHVVRLVLYAATASAKATAPSSSILLYARFNTSSGVLAFNSRASCLAPSLVMLLLYWKKKKIHKHQPEKFVNFQVTQRLQRASYLFTLKANSMYCLPSYR